MHVAIARRLYCLDLFQRSHFSKRHSEIEWSSAPRRRSTFLTSHIFGNPATVFVLINVLLIIAHIDLESGGRSQLLELFGSADFHFPVLAVDALFDAVQLALDDGFVELVVLFANGFLFRLVLTIDTLLNRFLYVSLVDGVVPVSSLILPFFPL